MTALASLAKEDPLKYFADPVDISLVPGYRDVVGRLLIVRILNKESISADAHARTAALYPYLR